MDTWPITSPHAATDLPVTDTGVTNQQLDEPQAPQDKDSTRANANSAACSRLTFVLAPVRRHHSRCDVLLSRAQVPPQVPAGSV